MMNHNNFDDKSVLCHKLGQNENDCSIQSCASQENCDSLVSRSEHVHAHMSDSTVKDEVDFHNQILGQSTYCIIHIVDAEYEKELLCEQYGIPSKDPDTDEDDDGYQQRTSKHSFNNRPQGTLPFQQNVLPLTLVGSTSQDPLLYNLVVSNSFHASCTKFKRENMLKRGSLQRDMLTSFDSSMSRWKRLRRLSRGKASINVKTKARIQGQQRQVYRKNLPPAFDDPPIRIWTSSKLRIKDIPSTSCTPNNDPYFAPYDIADIGLDICVEDEVSPSPVYKEEEGTPSNSNYSIDHNYCTNFSSDQMNNSNLSSPLTDEEPILLSQELTKDSGSDGDASSKSEKEGAASSTSACNKQDAFVCSSTVTAYRSKTNAVTTQMKKDRCNDEKIRNMSTSTEYNCKTHEVLGCRPALQSPSSSERQHHRMCVGTYETDEEDLQRSKGDIDTYIERNEDLENEEQRVNDNHKLYEGNKPDGNATLNSLNEKNHGSELDDNLRGESVNNTEQSTCTFLRNSGFQEGQGQGRRRMYKVKRKVANLNSVTVIENMDASCTTAAIEKNKCNRNTAFLENMGESQVLPTTKDFFQGLDAHQCSEKKKKKIGILSSMKSCKEQTSNRISKYTLKRRNMNSPECSISSSHGTFLSSLQNSREQRTIKRSSKIKHFKASYRISSKCIQKDLDSSESCDGVHENIMGSIEDTNISHPTVLCDEAEAHLRRNSFTSDPSEDITSCIPLKYPQKSLSGRNQSKDGVGHSLSKFPIRDSELSSAEDISDRIMKAVNSFASLSLENFASQISVENSGDEGDYYAQLSNMMSQSQSQRRLRVLKNLSSRILKDLLMEIIIELAAESVIEFSHEHFEEYCVSNLGESVCNESSYTDARVENVIQLCSKERLRELAITSSPRKLVDSHSLIGNREEEWVEEHTSLNNNLIGSNLSGEWPRGISQNQNSMERVEVLETTKGHITYPDEQNTLFSALGLVHRAISPVKSGCCSLPSPPYVAQNETQERIIEREGMEDVDSRVSNLSWSFKPLEERDLEEYEDGCLGPYQALSKEKEDTQNDLESNSGLSLEDAILSLIKDTEKEFLKDIDVQNTSNKTASRKRTIASPRKSKDNLNSNRIVLLRKKGKECIRQRGNQMSNLKQMLFSQSSPRMSKEVTYPKGLHTGHEWNKEDHQGSKSEKGPNSKNARGTPSAMAEQHPPVSNASSTDSDVEGTLAVRNIPTLKSIVGTNCQMHWAQPVVVLNRIECKSSKLFVCSFCDKIFSDYRFLQHHTILYCRRRLPYGLCTSSHCPHRYWSCHWYRRNRCGKRSEQKDAKQACKNCGCLSGTGNVNWTHKKNKLNRAMDQLTVSLRYLKGNDRVKDDSVSTSDSMSVFLPSSSTTVNKVNDLERESAICMNTLSEVTVASNPVNDSSYESGPAFELEESPPLVKNASNAAGTVGTKPLQNIERALISQTQETIMEPPVEMVNNANSSPQSVSKEPDVETAVSTKEGSVSFEESDDLSGASDMIINNAVDKQGQVPPACSTVKRDVLTADVSLNTKNCANAEIDCIVKIRSALMNLIAETNVTDSFKKEFSLPKSYFSLVPRVVVKRLPSVFPMRKVTSNINNAEKSVLGNNDEIYCHDDPTDNSVTEVKDEVIFVDSPEKSTDIGRYGNGLSPIVNIELLNGVEKEEEEELGDTLSTDKSDDTLNKEFVNVDKNRELTFRNYSGKVECISPSFPDNLSNVNVSNEILYYSPNTDSVRSNINGEVICNLDKGYATGNGNPEVNSINRVAKVINSVIVNSEHNDPLASFEVGGEEPEIDSKDSSSEPMSIPIKSPKTLSPIQAQNTIHCADLDIKTEIKDVRIELIPCDVLLQEMSVTVKSPEKVFGNRALGLRSPRKNAGSNIISCSESANNHGSTSSEYSEGQNVPFKKDRGKSKIKVSHCTVMHEGRRWYPCSVCNHKFKFSGDLGRHMRKHTNERPYKCPICPKAYKQTTALKVHLAAHEGKRPFVCQWCGMNFSQKSHLKTHTRIHTGERPFKCILCGKSFTRHDHLQAHSYTHTRERPFKCKICPESFRSDSHLSKHNRQHQNDLRYKCKICDMSFLVAHSLNMHYRKHTGEKPEKCHLCAASFRYFSSLRKHIKAKHA